MLTFSQAVEWAKKTSAKIRGITQYLHYTDIDGERVYWINRAPMYVGQSGFINGQFVLE